MNPLWTLAPASALLGAAVMWAFRRIGNREAIGAAIGRVQAYLLEFWLFVDEPWLIGKSWRGLLAANARLLRLLALPLAAISVPMVPLFFCLDAWYGVSPLPVGKPAVVTMRIDGPLDVPPALKAPDGIAVESPPVRIFSEGQVSWRIRPRRALSGQLRCVVAGKELGKSVEAGDGPRYLSRKRTRSLLELIRYPAERPLEAGPVEWIEVSYPPAGVRLFGLELHWSIWFVAFSLLGAVLAPR